MEVLNSLSHARVCWRSLRVKNISRRKVYPRYFLILGVVKRKNVRILNVSALKVFFRHPQVTYRGNQGLPSPRKEPPHHGRNHYAYKSSPWLVLGAASSTGEICWVSSVVWTALKRHAEPAPIPRNSFPSRPARRPSTESSTWKCPTACRKHGSAGGQFASEITRVEKFIRAFSLFLRCQEENCENGESSAALSASLPALRAWSAF
jgi:hypothetical protein